MLSYFLSFFLSSVIPVDCISFDLSLSLCVCTRVVVVCGEEEEEEDEDVENVDMGIFFDVVGDGKCGGIN